MVTKTEEAMETDERASSSRKRARKSNSDEPASNEDINQNRQLASDDDHRLAGRISSIELRDFMCHQNLKIDFNIKDNNCFYIGGANGSGKSALFAGINLGLGGRGCDNDRGKSVKEYIRHGQSSAKIAVTLSNTGMNSHPDYGESVIIERTINQSSSTYAIKSVSGSVERVVSRKKSDVDCLMNRYNIHVSIWAFWMTQDRCRNFLSNFKPATVFKYYMDSTNLDAIKAGYERFAGCLHDLKMILDKKTYNLEKKRREIQRMKENRERHMKLEEERGRYELFKWNIIFCSIRDVEDELQIINRKLDSNEKCQHDQNTIIQTVGNERRHLNMEGEDARTEVEQLADEMHDLKQDMKVARDAIDEQSLIIREANKVYLYKKEEKSATIEKIRTSERTVEELIAKSGSDEMQRKLENSKKKLRAIESELEDLENSETLSKIKKRVTDIGEEVKELDNNLYEFRRDMKETADQRDKLRYKLNQATAVKKDTINKYGPRMSEILAAIERKKSSFSKMPKGPLGKYISITNSEWAYPIETCISTIANFFLCDNSADAHIMRGIFRDLRLRQHEQPTLMISKFLGVPHRNLREPSSQYLTVYKCLNISDPDANNALIDKLSVEGVILLRDNKEAMNLMDSRTPPENATQAYTLDGSQAYAGGSVGQYRFYSGKGGTARGIFQEVEQRYDEQALRKELAVLDEKAKGFDTEMARTWERNLNALRAEKVKKSDEGDRIENKQRDLTNMRTKMEREVKDVQFEIENQNDQEEVDNWNKGIEDLKSKVPIIEKDMEEALAKKEEETLKLEPLRIKEQKLKSEEMELKKEIDEKRKAVEELESKLSGKNEKVAKAEKLMEKLQADLENLRRDHQLKEKKLDETKANVDVLKEQVPRPHDAEDPPDLSNFPPTAEAQRQMEEMTKKLQKDGVTLDKNVTMEEIAEYKREFKELRKMLSELQDIVTSLSEIFNNRISLYPKLRKCTEMKVRRKFTDLLKIRGNFIGDLEFDYDNQTLDINVTACLEKDGEQVQQKENRAQEDSESDEDDRPPAKKKSKKAKKEKRDLKSLSGGERSYVTASFIMSLWEVMEQPFRMMDEFDVFMDMLNRKVVMDLLVELATEQFPHNQFIFFTPQGIKELKRVDGLEIFEMNPIPR